MKIEEIKALAEVFTQANLSVLEYAQGEMKIRMERSVTEVPSGTKDKPVQEVQGTKETQEQENDFNNLHEMKAPMVGVFYAAPSPDSEPFIKVGDMVEKGQVVCILEAMKLMNDITAPVSGRVVDICAQNGMVVEYGQTLIKIV